MNGEENKHHHSREVEIFGIENPIAREVVESLTAPDSKVSYEELQERFGLTEEQIRRWRRDRGFQHLLWESSINAVQAQVHCIIKGLYEAAITPSKSQVGAIKLLLEVIERYKPAAVRYLEEKDRGRREEEADRHKTLKDITKELRDIVQMAGLEGVIEVKPVTEETECREIMVIEGQY